MHCDCDLKHAYNYDCMHQRDPFYTIFRKRKRFANFLEAILLSKINYFKCNTICLIF